MSEISENSFAAKSSSLALIEVLIRVATLRKFARYNSHKAHNDY